MKQAMAMKLNFLHSFWAAALLLASVSCTREELPSAPSEGGVCPLSITVADGGYAAADGQTKATENGCRTEFTAGDECGLYIVRGGTVVYNNVKLTATAGADGSLTWQPEAGTELGGGLDGETYCLYCPYQADMSGKVDVTATDAEGFFAPLVSGWQPKADQSTYANYTASDLMTAKGTAAKGTDGSLKLSFSMSHRMAMAVIEMPPTVYKFTNTDVAIPDYTGGGSSADFTSSAVKPYSIAPGTYRCIFNPASGTATSITGSYADGWKEFTVTPDGVAANCCRAYRIDGLNPTEKSYSLQVGDYFCRNSIGLWYIIPKAEKPGSECIGAVFYVGQHPNDGSDYSGTGIGKKNCHGYAVAMKDATTDYCMWGAFGKELGCYPKDGSGNKPDNLSNPGLDWSGYDWTWKIINNGARGLFSLNATEPSGYPATYYAVADYQDKISAATGSSGWFLPSVGQMWEVYRNRDSLFADKSVATGLRPDCYWSSSEYSSWPGSYVLFVDSRDGRVYGTGKDYNKGYVRPVLAF